MGQKGKTSNATSKSPDLTNIDSPKPAGGERTWGTWNVKNWHQGFTCLLSHSSRGDREDDLLEDLDGRLLSPNGSPEERNCFLHHGTRHIYIQREGFVILRRQTPIVNLPAAVSCSLLPQDGGNSPPCFLAGGVMTGCTPAAQLTQPPSAW